MKARTRNRLLIVASLISVLVWPWVYYARPYPAFGGESLLVIATITGYVVSKFLCEEERS